MLPKFVCKFILKKLKASVKGFKQKFWEN